MRAVLATFLSLMRQNLKISNPNTQIKERKAYLAPSLCSFSPQSAGANMVAGYRAAEDSRIQATRTKGRAGAFSSLML